MRVVCISDLHENLPERLPEGDLLCIAGDITFAFKHNLPAQQEFIAGPFAEWLETLDFKEIAVVAGNHDVSVEKWGWPQGLRCTYLQDQEALLCSKYVYGTPWQPYFYDWAFNAPERHGEEWLYHVPFKEITMDTDIVICHGPPRGFCDQSGNPHAADRSGQPNVGSQALTRRLREACPDLLVCGHIHSGYGQTALRDEQGNALRTKIVNCSLVDNRYQLVNDPIVVDL